MTTRTPATHDALAGILREVDDKLSGATGDHIRGKHLRTHLDLDSLDVIKFILLLEERYGLKIPDEDIDGRELLAVDNLVGYLAERAK
jgi:acyl carrier protein